MTEFARLPYVKGFQTGMLTPILNALRPKDYLLVNYKSRRTINYFSTGSYGLEDVREGYAMVEGGGGRGQEALCALAPPVG